MAGGCHLSQSQKLTVSIAPLTTLHGSLGSLFALHTPCNSTPFFKKIEREGTRLEGNAAPGGGARDSVSWCCASRAGSVPAAIEHGGEPRRLGRSVLWTREASQADAPSKPPATCLVAKMQGRCGRSCVMRPSGGGDGRAGLGRRTSLWVGANFVVVVPELGAGGCLFGSSRQGAVRVKV